jgi:hypothetical protein
MIWQQSCFKAFTKCYTLCIAEDYQGFVQTESNVVGDGFKKMFYNIAKCKVFSARLLPYIRQYLRNLG